MNGYYSRYRMPDGVEKRRKQGMKVIIVDPRITPSIPQTGRSAFTSETGNGWSPLLCQSLMN